MYFSICLAGCVHYKCSLNANWSLGQGFTQRLLSQGVYRKPLAPGFSCLGAVPIESGLAVRSQHVSIHYITLTLIASDSR